MGRAISNKNVLTAKFEVADFDGAFLASFGRPELRGAWIIYGGSGCGKTTFVMQVCKYLTRFRRVAYNSLEQGLSLSLQKAWERVGMEEVGNRIILLNKDAGVTNDYFKESNKHYITLNLTTTKFSGTPRCMEPDKCAEWKWFDLDNLPKNLFLSTQNFFKEHKL